MINKEKLIKKLEKFYYESYGFIIHNCINLSNDATESFIINEIHVLDNLTLKSIIDIEYKEKVYVEIQQLAYLKSKDKPKDKLTLITFQRSYPLFIFDDSLSDEKYKEFLIDYINNYKIK